MRYSIGPPHVTFIKSLHLIEGKNQWQLLKTNCANPAGVRCGSGLLTVQPLSCL